jgi:hypothetical protein
MAVNNIQSSAKSGLGTALVIDGQQFPAAWKPSAINFDRNTVDTTHAQSTNFKSSRPEELAEPLEVVGQMYFDPQQKQVIELMTSEGVTQEREIYIILAQTSTPQGVTHENGFFLLPAGSIGLGSIELDIDGNMMTDFVVTAGQQAVTIGRQKLVAGNTPTGITVTTNELSAALIVEDTIVATIAVDGLTYGAGIVFALAGTDVADFYIDGYFVKAVAAGGGGSGVKALTVSTAGYTSWEQDIVAQHDLAVAVGFTLTA